MSERNDGGPAFPFLEDFRGGAAGAVSPGMTLRDWFAGQALAGILAAPPDAVSQDLGPNARASRQRAAEWSYIFADAMLEERKS